jgi:hypothetical protein
LYDQRWQQVLQLADALSEPTSQFGDSLFASNKLFPREISILQSERIPEQDPGIISLPGWISTGWKHLRTFLLVMLTAASTRFNISSL